MDKDTCSIEGCARPRKARGWCKTHWQRWSRTGDPGAEMQIRAFSTGPETCSIEDCDRPVKHRGWCGMHYQRWQRHGDPGAETIARYESFADSFAANVSAEPDQDGCVFWTGATTAAGYGRVQTCGESMYAHRYAWERANRVLSPGELVDHICHNARCVNAEHLRLATKAENGQNRSGPAPTSSTGVRGVHRKRDRYKVSFTTGGVNFSGGTFLTVEEAAPVAAKLRAELFGEFAGRG